MPGKRTPVTPDTIIWKTIRLLRERPKQAWSPKEIAREIDEKPGSVRQAIRRHLETPRPQIKQIEEGQYRAFVDGETLRSIECPDPKCHGLELVVPVSRDGWSPPKCLFERNEANASEWASLQWAGRPVTFQWFEDPDRLKVSVQSSEDPIGFEELAAVESWFQGLLEGWGLEWLPKAVRVVNVEVNLDFCSLSLRGASCVRWSQWKDAWIQLYQKGDQVRLEGRLHKPELDLDEMLSIIDQFTRPPPPSRSGVLPESSGEEVNWG